MQPKLWLGLKSPKPPQIIHCTTGNVFDHTVRLSGEDPTDWKKDLNFHGVHQRERTRGQTSSLSTATPRYVSNTRTPNSMYNARSTQTAPPPSTPPVRETRPLSEISDEEFDVPPLFDDISYEADDVPDLNFDEPDAEPSVGKLYAPSRTAKLVWLYTPLKNVSTSGKLARQGIHLSLVATTHSMTGGS